MLQFFRDVAAHQRCCSSSEMLQLIRDVAVHQRCSSSSEMLQFIRDVAAHCCSSLEMLQFIRDVAAHQRCCSSSEMWQFIRNVAAHQRCGFIYILQYAKEIFLCVWPIASIATTTSPSLLSPPPQGAATVYGVERE